MITVTELAHRWIWDAIQHRTKTTQTVGIRFGVRTTGCSGLAYTIEFENPSASGENSPHDEVQVHVSSDKNRGFLTFVSKKDLPYLQGMTVDYVYEGLNGGLKFINPNERSQCGCGESFSV
jgi:iron-sulfur cluster assembly protein